MKDLSKRLERDYAVQQEIANLQSERKTIQRSGVIVGGMAFTAAFLGLAGAVVFVSLMMSRQMQFESGVAFTLLCASVFLIASGVYRESVFVRNEKSTRLSEEILLHQVSLALSRFERLNEYDKEEK